MKKNSSKAESVNSYISAFPRDTQKMLKQLRAAIKKAVPEAVESISYQMPFYSYHGRLVYFAGYEHHIGLYPMSACIAHFKSEIAAYKHAKGSVQFPLDKPLPLTLIMKMIMFRAKENLKKSKTKSETK